MTNNSLIGVVQYFEADPERNLTIGGRLIVSPIASDKKKITVKIQAHYDEYSDDNSRDRANKEFHNSYNTTTTADQFAYVFRYKREIYGCPLLCTLNSTLFKINIEKKLEYNKTVNICLLLIS